MVKKVGIIGSGQVSKILGDGFIKYGSKVMLGSRDPAKLKEWAESHPGTGLTGTFEEAAEFGQLIVLAVKGTAAREALEMIDASALAGKTVIDATNPISNDPPENGVLKYFSSLDRSLMEDLQAARPEANFVKAFNSVGGAYMVNPDFGAKPTMFICGNDAGAKQEVRSILDNFGWEVEDFGGVEAARAIEPLCMLWCIPGFREGRWSHAFKLLKK